MTSNRMGWAFFGFLVGTALGSGFGYLLLLFFDQVSRWLGKPVMAITWAQVLPIGVLIGISTAINMYRPPLGD